MVKINVFIFIFLLYVFVFQLQDHHFQISQLGWVIPHHLDRIWHTHLPRDSLVTHNPLLLRDNLVIHSLLLLQLMEITGLHHRSIRHKCKGKINKTQVFKIHNFTNSSKGLLLLCTVLMYFFLKYFPYTSSRTQLTT